MKRKNVHDLSTALARMLAEVMQKADAAHPPNFVLIIASGRRDKDGNSMMAVSGNASPQGAREMLAVALATIDDKGEELEGAIADAGIDEHAQPGTMQ